jgi:NDP-sugar pyrophosphorylase family protein
LTDTTPKPLLDLAGTTLLDLALDRLATVLPVDPDHVAVNAHWLADQVRSHVAGRAHVSVEDPEALGTAGAVGQLREWLAGRDVLVTNSDAWYDPPPDLTPFVHEWDGRRPRLLVVEDEERADFEGRWRFAGTSLLPWGLARDLAPVPSGLYELVWSQVPVELVPTTGRFVDCGTPDDLALVRRLVGGT